MNFHHPKRKGHAMNFHHPKRKGHAMNFHHPKRKGHAMNTITIHTTGNATEDLRTLCQRIHEGDAPGTRELLAVLENCVALLQERDSME